MNLLHLDSSVLGENSVSRQLSAAIVARIAGAEDTVVYRDLIATPPAHLTGRYLMGASDAVQHDQALQGDLELGGALLAEFLAADTVVIGVPLYNFTVPTQLKAWVDRILIAGQTFRYTATGAEGLAGGKRIVLAIARGGFYSPGSPHAGAEHCETYLRTVFGFIGIYNVEAIVAEGIAIGPEQRAAAVEGALAAVAALPV